MICNHDLAEKDTACADGMCPLCLSAEGSVAKKAVETQRKRADANLEYAKKCETLLRRLWIQINGDDVFLMDAIEGQESVSTREDQFAAKPKLVGSIIEEIGCEITWKILGGDAGWYVCASHTGADNPDDDFKFSGRGDNLNEAIVTVVEELLAIGPEWVRLNDTPSTLQEPIGD